MSLKDQPETQYRLPDGRIVSLRTYRDSEKATPQVVCFCCGKWIHLTPSGGLSLYDKHYKSRRCEELAKEQRSHAIRLSRSVLLTPGPSLAPGDGNLSDDDSSSTEDASSELCDSLADLTVTQPVIECTGVLTQWEPGSVWDTYPYQLHASHRLAWSIAGIENNTHLRIQSATCHVVIDPGNQLENNTRACMSCLQILNSPAFIQFMQRAVHTAEHTPYAFLTPKQLIALLLKKSSELAALRTRLNTQSLRIHHLERKLDDYDRILVLLSENNIPSLRRLLAVALRNRVSISTIIQQLQRAIEGVYSPLGRWTERELDIAYLCKALGGPRLLYALSHSEGFPSVTTISKRCIPRLLPSVATPSDAEIHDNIAALLTVPHPNKAGGMVLMMDGIALEEVCRYDAQRNCIVGLCREHSSKITTTVTGANAIKHVADMLYKDKTCHHGKDGTVVAIGSISGNDNYVPVPLLLSPSCKAETGVSLATWLARVLSIYKEHPNGQAMNGPICTISSDGESSFRAARFNLCMSQSLDPHSLIGQTLYKLVGLNTRTGVDNLLASCDPKHVIKRFATFLRNPSGIQVHDTIILPLTVQHTLEYLMSKSQAEELLNPADKQNVPKAVSLIQHLQRLEHHDRSTYSPSEQHRLLTVIFVAKMLGYFVQPFVDRSMSLSQQVQFLSTYAHLTAAMFIKHGTSFMKGALYADSHAIVKAIVFTIARLQTVDPTLNYYILLEGTDRLEMLFSDVRTQDHSRNVDVLQLSQKLSISVEINAIFARHPELDRGHRRLNVGGAMGIDHVNPKSWDGDVCVGSVNLLEEWDKGRQLATNLLVVHMPEKQPIDFIGIFQGKEADLLRPKGEYVGTRWEPDDEVPGPGMQPQSADTTTKLEDDGILPDMPTCSDVPEGMGLEEMLDADIMGGEGALVEYEGQTYFKASLIAALLTSKGARKVTIRTQRARGVSIQETLKRSHPNHIPPIDEVPSGELIKAGDLIGCLLRTSGSICFAVMEILHFESLSNGTHLSAVSIKDLELMVSPKYCISCQTLELILQGSGDSLRWVWTRKYISYTDEGEGSEGKQMTQRDYILKIPGFLAQVLDPIIVDANRDPEEGAIASKVWAIPSVELVQALDKAWARLNSESEPGSLGSMANELPYLRGSSLPYKDMHGNMTLQVVNPPAHLIATKLQGDEVTPCKLCGKRVKLSMMRNHVGFHILYVLRDKEDPSVERYGQKVGVDPCGWCGQEGCFVRLTKKGKSITITSNCAYHYERMSYKQALKCTPQTTPCTNVPIHCPLCPSSANGQPVSIWKYNTIYHLLKDHATEEAPIPQIPPRLLVDMFISREEEKAMGIDVEATTQYRESHQIPGSDDVAKLRDDMDTAESQKRSRAASSVSISATGSRKVARRG